MACFFRRSIAAKLGRSLQQPENAFIPCLSAVPVSKKQVSTDFKLSVNTLRMNGIIPTGSDLQLQTEAIAKELKPDSVLEEICVGRGVIYFTVNRKLLVQKMLEPFGKDTGEFGLKSDLLNALQKGTTLVEFSSPNIAKKFHAGHLRSTIIGNFVANLKQCIGNKVIRMNYLGDWGMQFGLLGVGFDKYGSQEKLKENPLQHLFDIYVQINQDGEDNDDTWKAARDFFLKLEQHESQAISLWRQFREITVKEYQHVYKRLGVHFDIYSGESFHQEQAQEVVNQLKRQGLLQTTEKGTGVVDLSPAGDMSSYSTVLRSDGTSLYITRDIAAAVDRKEKYNFNEMIYVTDKSQENHFQQLFKILRSMEHAWAESCRHVSFGVVRGMRTRRGEVVFLEDVLDEARSRMLHNMSQTQNSHYMGWQLHRATKLMENPDDIAEKVGISALIVQDFRGPLQSDYTFDWDRILQAQGDTGVFLQYTHARLRSLIRMNDSIELGLLDPSLLLEHKSIAILQHFLRYDEVLYQSAQDLQPRHLVTFLMNLCHLVASAHRELTVKGSTLNLAQARLQLFRGACTVLAHGMKMLGITPVEKM